MTHVFYVTAAYTVSALGIAGLLAWVLVDQRARKAELAELERAGVRRRSAERAGQ